LGGGLKGGSLKNKWWILGLILLVWGWWLVIPDNKLKVIFCDVGQGDAAIITKGYFQAMIDVGPKKSWAKLARCLDDHMPLTDKTIELLFLSHNDEDHIGAREELEKFYKIEQTFDSAKLGKNDVVRNGEMSFEIVYPDKNIILEGNDSLVILFKYKNERILFEGDADRIAEEILVETLRNESVGMVKVAHHGSKTSSDDFWVSFLHPEWVIISVGKNSFGHPDFEVLERWRKVGAKVLRTDEVGSVVFVER
jgi:competence protein ComEC